MNVSGLPQEQLDLIKELEDMERSVLGMVPKVAPELVAQALTCLSYDWLDLGLEEKANLLLLEADRICPGYHGNQMKKHMAEDPDFNYLVQQLGKELLTIAVSTMRSGKA